jgi:hypothetical protein
LFCFAFVDASRNSNFWLLSLGAHAFFLYLFFILSLGISPFIVLSSSHLTPVFENHVISRRSGAKFWVTLLCLLLSFFYC